MVRVMRGSRCLTHPVAALDSRELVHVNYGRSQVVAARARLDLDSPAALFVVAVPIDKAHIGVAVLGHRRHGRRKPACQCEEGREEGSCED